MERLGSTPVLLTADNLRKSLSCRSYASGSEVGGNGSEVGEQFGGGGVCLTLRPVASETRFDFHHSCQQTKLPARPMFRCISQERVPGKDA
jgi:hypothetical protein